MNKLIAGLVVSAALVCAAEPPIAIRNARIVTVSGPAIEKGTVVVRDGVIERVGASVAIPPEAWVMEGDGLTVYPGLIDALSTIGVPEPAPGPPQPPAPIMNASWQNAADMIQPTERRVAPFRSAGFTTAAVFPTRGIFAGRGAIVNLAGETAAEMVAASPVGEYLTLSTSGSFGVFPGSLMGTLAFIRQTYADAGRYRTVQAQYSKNPRGVAHPSYDRLAEGVLGVPRILLPANRAVEVDRMLRFASGLGQPFVLYGLAEGYRAAPMLKQAGASVVVSLKWPEKNKDGDPEEVEPVRVLEMRDRAPSTPAELARAGVRFAFSTGGIATPREVLTALKRALDAGLTHDQAVRAMTLDAARIYGVDDRMGSIEAGKIANLVVTRGALFEEKSKVEFVFVEGRKFIPAPEPQPAKPEQRQ